METIDKWKELTFTTLGSLFDQMASGLNGIVAALFILIIGWILTKVVLWLLVRVLKAAKADTLSERLNEARIFGDTDLKIDLKKVALSFAKALMWLILIVAIADVLQLNVISEEIAKLLQYLPVLITALFLFVGGMYLAQQLRKGLVRVFETMGIGGGKLIGGVVFGLVTVMVTVTAMNHAGIDTSLITSNFNLIIGAFLAAIALGFGLGSREVFQDLLRTFYIRKNYMVGDEIQVGKWSGTVEAIDNISLTLMTDKGRVVLPIRKIADKEVIVKRTSEDENS
ncbi:mechanosensitive ion channel family protein [Aureicoccus marinus]|uniref:Mechanosensitive ion channel MscS domain-containing protein n=1 Tax=Aureicoccus marinus TaxID=754435 RepID=A0A2S7T833_9FLAO|nr:mechanosensitive ion channel domain-containing protein [Aureicoccus marinus]PQJ15616.1 hypothetical protein BST99_07635 [Aureicoccus marinus]